VRAINVCAMLDNLDDDFQPFLFDAVDDAVITTSSSMQTRQLKAKRVADPMRLVG
jgi:hypothetical protein